MHLCPTGTPYARAERYCRRAFPRNKYAAGEACEVADMQPMHDWVASVSSYRRPSHAMQAMQRHPQRTRGPETDMSFDKTNRGVWDSRRQDANERISGHLQTRSTPHKSEMRSQLRRPQQPPSVCQSLGRGYCTKPQWRLFCFEAVRCCNFFSRPGHGQYEVTVRPNQRSGSISRNASRTGPLSSILASV